MGTNASPVGPGDVESEHAPRIRSPAMTLSFKTWWIEFIPKTLSSHGSLSVSSRQFSPFSTNGS
jgi:hypothetical protein